MSNPRDAYIHVCSGGYHGNGDDVDMDIKMITRVNSQLQAHCPWNTGDDEMGGIGFKYAPKLESKTASALEFKKMFTDEDWEYSEGKKGEEFGGQDSWFRGSCICQYRLRG